MGLFDGDGVDVIITGSSLRGVGLGGGGRGGCGMGTSVRGVVRGVKNAESVLNFGLSFRCVGVVCGSGSGVGMVFVLGRTPCCCTGGGSGG